LKETIVAEIRKNPAKAKLQRGQTVSVISGNMTSEIIDFLGPMGFDGAWIEGEHGPVSWEQISDMTRACDLWGISSITRVNSNDAGLITRTLDRGSMGIVVPHVNTREAAEKAMMSAKFAPIGYRGMFGGRQSYGVPDYFHTANDQTLVVVLLEELEALQNLGEILRVDYIDVFLWPLLTCPKPWDTSAIPAILKCSGPSKKPSPGSYPPEESPEHW
jgi:4-hydroxy-2-oxoheptanedioate aldolase